MVLQMIQEIMGKLDIGLGTGNWFGTFDREEKQKAGQGVQALAEGICREVTSTILMRVNISAAVKRYNKVVTIPSELKFQH
jgi:hypothetical protein